jgi:hypothetical protein
MEYNNGEKIIVVSNAEIKTIIDSEIINGIELYYMSDKTAYPLDQIINESDFLYEFERDIDNLFLELLNEEDELMRKEEENKKNNSNFLSYIQNKFKRLTNCFEN